MTSSKQSSEKFQISELDRSRLDLDDFAYELPPELIAQNGLAVRDQSRLLYYNRQKEQIAHHHFCDIASILQTGDVLAVNDTRVIPAKLIGRRAGGGVVELLLIKPEASSCDLWQAMAAPIKKLRVGETISVQGKDTVYNVLVEDIVVAQDGQKRLLVRLLDQNKKAATYNILQDAGLAPLPPYILRERKPGQTKDDSIEHVLNDLERYQTVFAKIPGAIAAPTAGLHFTPALLSALQDRGVTICEITLHVGPGTFKPIAAEIENHILEPEWFAISEQTAQIINTAKKNKQRIIAVGTTTCRALESACVNGRILSVDGSTTSLFIKPGYQFKLIDGLVTNFHLSKSSLLLLVAALIGKAELMRAYKIAIENKYRFYSYGDAMAIL